MFYNDNAQHLKKNIITKRFRDQTQLNYEFQLIWNLTAEMMLQ